MDSLPEPTAPARGATEFAETFPKNAGLALAEHGTRCGKPGCKCTRGELHPTAYLRWREGGAQRRRYVRKGELSAVRAVLARRRTERDEERAALALARASLRSWRDLARQLERRHADYRNGGAR